MVVLIRSWPWFPGEAAAGGPFLTDAAGGGPAIGEAWVPAEADRLVSASDQWSGSILNLQVDLGLILD